MIIWGTRGITSTVESAEFYCPNCGEQRNGSIKQVRNFFTLYFIPIIPLNVAGRYVECDSCDGAYEEDILNYDPAQDEMQFNTQMLRIMVMAALADGVVDDAERAEIQRQYMGLAGLPVPGETLSEEIRLASNSGADLNAFVGNISHNISDHEKALIVKLAFQTMSASGELQAGHQEQLARLAATLSIPDATFRELILTFSESDD